MLRFCDIPIAILLYCFVRVCIYAIDSSIKVPSLVKILRWSPRRTILPFATSHQFVTREGFVLLADLGEEDIPNSVAHSSPVARVPLNGNTTIVVSAQAGW